MESLLNLYESKFISRAEFLELAKRIPHVMPEMPALPPTPYKKSNNRVARPADPNLFKKLDQKRYDDLKKLAMADKINKQNQMIKKMALELKNSQINENIIKKKTAIMLPLNNLHVQSRVELYQKTAIENFDDEDVPTEWITDYTPMQSINKVLSPEEIIELKKIIEKKYNDYDYEVVSIVPATRIDVISNTGFIEVKNKQKSLAYKILDDINQDKEKVYNDNLCVPRYLLKSLIHIDGFKLLTLNKIKEQFNDINVNVENGVSVEELKAWIIRYYPKTIAMYAIDPLLNIFDNYSSGKTVLVTLAFVINNGHVYPIFDNVQKKIIAHTQNKSIQLKEISWEVDANNYQTIKYYHRSNNPDLDHGVDVMEGSNDDYDKLVQGKGNKYTVALIENSLEEIMKDVINETGYLVTGMKIRNGVIEAFQHPVNEQIIELAIDLDKRKYICEKLYGLFGYECFKWKNQSFAMLVNSLFEIKNGKLEQSTHIKEDQKIYDTYHTSPLINTLVDIPYDDACYGFDCKKSYPNAMINMTDDYPVFSICDQFTKYENDDITVGEYVIDDIVIESLGNIQIKKQVVGYNFVKYLLANKYMTTDKILFVKKASYNVKKEIFSNFIKELKEMFGEDSIEYKSLAHCFIGNFGKRYSTLDCGFVSDDWETVSASYHEYSKNGDWNVKTVEGLHFVRVKQRTRLFSENSQIFRQVLSQGMIQLLELIKMVYGDKSLLVGYNTDSVFVRNPKIVSFPKNHPLYRKESWKPKKYYPEEKDTRNEIKCAEVKEWVELSKDLENKSFCCIGPGGAGKSTELVKNFDKGSTIVLALSNKACDNIRKKGIDEVFTFNSYFDHHEKISDNITKILIDEYSMLPTKWIKILYNLKTQRPNIIIQFYGDSNQCKQVCKHRRYFDYRIKYVFGYLCDFNQVTKEYIEGSARYDRELYEVLTHLINTGCLHNKLKNRPIDPTLETNIVMSNNKRFEINDQFATEWTPGMKIIAKINDKTNNVFNSQIFYIKDILSDKYITISETPGGDALVKDDKIINFLRSRFDPAFAVTVYKYQGDTISDNYNIHQAQCMDRNELYTALSRARTLSQIHIKWTKKEFKFASEPEISTNIGLKAPQIGYIYYMYNDDQKVCYVGQTTKTIAQRFDEHFDDPNDSIYNYPGEWNIKEISKVMYTNDSTLNLIEKRYIHKYYKLNDYKVINKQNLPKEAKINKINISVGNVDETMKNRLKYEEHDNFLRFKKSIDGKIIEKKIQFGVRKTKDEAIKQMDEFTSKLALQFFN